MYEKVGSRRPGFSVFALHECPSERNYQQKLDIPQAIMQLVGFYISVEGMQFGVELLFVKQMYQLAAMELDGVDEKDSVVDTWYDGCICLGQTASAVL
jgi:hypothetical protein